MAGALVSLAGVTKDYPKVATGGDRLRTLAGLLFRRRDLPHFRALEDVNLEVLRGQSVGVIGENGAGKSTLLKIIAGVVRPRAGTVRVNGRVGALLELGSGFHPEYTGRENIHLSSALMGLTRRETLANLPRIIEFADIGAHIDEPVKHYSSGMVVRLGFAVATVMSPELLITDEVLAVGDESFQKKCVAWLERFLRDGGTLLLCSHSMFHIQTLCSRAIWIHHGRVRMEGPSFDVTREYLTYHQERTAAERKAAAEHVVGAGLLRLEDAWLEQPDGTRASTYRRGETMVLQATAFEPDDRPPVLLFGVVRVDGTVGDVRVTKSLDPGLDQEAIVAAKQWRFRPGRDATGMPVPVLVTIILDFRLADEPPKVELRSPLPTTLTPEFLQDARLFGAPGMTAPELLAVVQAEPTDMATMMKIQGSVDIDFVVGIDGTVIRARVARSLDQLYGLDERAVAAVKTWKFKPAQQSGEAVPVAASVTLVFRVK